MSGATTIRTVMRPAVTTIDRHSHLAGAAYLMRHAGDTAIVVTTDDDARRPIAIITEADITDAVADGKDVNEVRIDELVGREPMTVRPEATIGEAVELMLSAGIHHLPVVEEDRLLGIVDITDACRALVSVTDVGSESPM
jgi:CBS domain-containing protein